MDRIRFIRELPVTKEFDVIVAGGGPAGLGAAVTSARLGAKTSLLERLGVLGGMFVSGHVLTLFAAVSSGTIRDEVHKLLDTKHTRNRPDQDQIATAAIDVEKAKILLPQWVVDAGVHLLLQTQVVDVVIEDGKITGVVVSTKSGLELYKGKMVIDATGDGTAAYLSGADAMLGRDGDGLLQPATLMFTIAGVDTDKALIKIAERTAATINGENFAEVCYRKYAEGELPENTQTVRLYPSTREGEILVNTTQANCINALYAEDITRAELILRKQIPRLIEFLKKYVPGYENCYLKDSADVLGVRETRRIKGEYVITAEDLLEGRKFEDVVVHNAAFPIDIHNPAGGGQGKGGGRQVKPYDIPYRCFVPLNVDNLLMAGRSISGTHEAHGSYRNMNICLAMGQAAAVAAVLSINQGVTPRDLDYKLIQKELQSQGVDLYGSSCVVNPL